MDNVCHTLVGAALAESGLKRQSRLATATLLVAANLPDIDVGVFLTSVPSVAFRRGWTHGVLAQALLPPLLVLVMMWLARRRTGPPEPVRPGWLLLLAYLGVFSHVGLDWLNNYGVRLLMPVSARWFYGDTLFIVDPWMWLMLGLGVWLSRRTGTTRAARRSLALATLYIALMLMGTRGARAAVTTAWIERHGAPPVALMVGPRAVTPLSRDIIVDAGDRYVTGTFAWWPTRVAFDADEVPKRDSDPAVAVARTTPDVAPFLVWSRFPVWEVQHGQDGTQVTVSDLRFGAVRRVIGGARFEAGTTLPR